jgi:toluene monooxygenase electron transfer component
MPRRPATSNAALARCSSACGPEDAYLLDELDRAAAASHGALSVTVAFSEGESRDAALYPKLSFAAGLVHAVAEERLAASLAAVNGAAAPVYFVAGPSPMVDATLRMLIARRKVSPTEIRYDRFT